MAYSRVNWVNQPSTTTPINATNLNKMDAAISSLDSTVSTKADQANGTPYWDFSSNTSGFVVTLRKTGNDPTKALGLAVTPSGASAATINNLINADGSRNFAYYGEYTSLRDQLNSRYFVNINGLNQESGHTFVDILSPFFTGYRNIGHGYYWNPPQDTFPGDVASRHEVIFINESGDRSYSKVIVIWAGGVAIGRCVPLNGVLDHIQWEEGSTQTRLVASLTDTDIYDTTYVSALTGAAYKAGNVVTLSIAFTIVGTTKATIRLNTAGVLPTCHAVGETLRPRCVCRLRTQDPDASTLVAEMMGNQVVILHNGVPGTYCGTITYISNAL